jgi:hypothetical protein
MRKHPVKAKSRAARNTSRAEVIPFETPVKAGAFISFHHSHVEMTSTPGGARVRAKHVRFEDGKLTSESFESALPAAAFEAALAQAQEYFTLQAALAFNPFSLFLAGGKK